MTKSHPAFVFGLSENGLSIIRGLARSGVEVVGIGYSKGIASYSKFAKSHILAHPQTHTENFQQQLLDLCAGFDQKPVAFIESDVYLQFFIHHNDFLKAHFIFNLSTPELIRKLQDKYEQFALLKNIDVNVPQTYRVESKEAFRQVSDEIELPVFVKGLDVNKWRAVVSGQRKGFKITDKEQLLRKVEELLDQDVPIIIQSLIVGRDTDNWKVSVLVDHSGEVRTHISMRKICQYPVYFGVGSVVKSEHNTALVEEASRMFKRIGYKGVGSAEYKYDRRTDTYVLIEINTRYWQQNSLARKSGLNFSMLDYALQVEQEVNIPQDFKSGINYINVTSAYKSMISYLKKGDFRHFFGAFRNPFKSYMSIFAFDDIRPSLVHTYRTTMRSIVKLIKK